MSNVFVSPSGVVFNFKHVMANQIDPDKRSPKVSQGITWTPVLAMPEHAAALAYMKWVEDRPSQNQATGVGVMVMNTGTFTQELGCNAVFEYLHSMKTHGHPDVRHIMWVAA